MAVPFAIAVPAVIYLLLQGGLHGAQQPRPGELGQHEQLRAHRRAAVHVHGGDPERQRLEQPHLRRARQAGRAAARRPAADQHRGLRDLCLGQRLEHRDRGLDRRRRAAAADQPQLQPRAGGRLARGRRHARHPDPAELPDDHLRHLHRNLGAEAVHRRRHSRPDHDGAVHALHRHPRARSCRPSRRASRARATCARCCARSPTSCRSSC